MTSLFLFSALLRRSHLEAHPYGPQTRVRIARHYGARALSHGKDEREELTWKVHLR